MTIAENKDTDDFLGRPPVTAWQRYGKWIGVGLGTILLLLVLSQYTAEDDGPEYLTSEIRRGDIAVNVTATGNLAPTNQVDIGSEISGVVEKVLVEANDRVEKGQPLAIIDTSRLGDAVTRARATLAASEASVGKESATLAEAQSQLDRLLEVQRLSGGQVPSRSELASQRAAVARAQGGLRSAEANVVSARAQLSSDSTQVAKAIIRSPVSGVVLKRTIDPGQTVQASFNTPSLFVIAEDLSRMKLEVSVDEADVGQVKAGQSATFTVDAFPRRSFPAAIERVDLGSRNIASSSSIASTSTTSNVVSYLATLSLSNAELILRPGMTATATIGTAGEKNVLIVPNAAVRFTPPANAKQSEKSTFSISPPRSEGTNVVRQREIGTGSKQRLYVLEEDGSLNALGVVTGQSDGRFTAVSGKHLRAGMRVVTGVKAQAEE
jgi:HlyD family secretion protein